MDIWTNYTNRLNKNAEWFKFYCDTKKEISFNANSAYSKSSKITSYVNTNHASEKIMRHIHTGILIFAN